MKQFDLISALILLITFLIEFSLMLLHRPKKEIITDMKTNLLIGASIILVGFFMKGLALTVFSLTYHYSIFKPTTSTSLWVAGVLCCDFIHWFYHWLGHKTRIFWAAHVTHHSSEFFNLSTGWRTNFIHLFYRFLFWSPLCFLGFPPHMILFIESITAIQNFLVHTEKIGKLGWLDYWFNTPSNHRVHHATNPEYIDKNLGGMLMIYDHLLGTYAKEKATPIYGITHNIHTQNPATIILHEFIHLIKVMPGIKGFKQKIIYLFSPPS